MLQVRRALISVWEKKGIVEFARKLSQLNVEIISTGKTAALLRNNDIPVKEVSALTSVPEILSGRVKTLHPKIFGGILANKKHPLHMEEIKNLGIQPIDMVVVNLYPFSEKMRSQLGQDEMLEYIDIGGTALLRAAAKNFKNVACVSSIPQYKHVIDELEKNKKFISEDTLKRLAAEAFYLTKGYDNDIYNYFRGQEVLTWNLEKVMPLRYGENPHQKADLYRLINRDTLKFTQVQGKELSYNNLLDLDAAVMTVREFSEPAAVIVKHASLCGVGIDHKLAAAYKKAYAVDPLSSFGGIIVLNRKVDKETACLVIRSEFKECLMAPAYSKEALKIFAAKKRLCLLLGDFLQKMHYKKDVRSSVFGYLIQEHDTRMLEKSGIKVVTKRKPTARELKDLLLAWKVVKFVKSNAITVVRNQQVLGIGGGQPSRVGAVKIALEKTLKPMRGAVMASDGFFPKEDSLAIAHRKGIQAIIQPGGSIKDEQIKLKCDKLGMSMVFTGIRHFRH